MHVTNIDKTAGAVVSGVHLQTLSEAEFVELHVLFLERGFLVIKDSAMSAAEQGVFGERFGVLEFAGAPMSNAKKDGEIVDVNTQQMRTNIGNEMWHTDSTYKPASSKVAMLTARVLPASGGGQTGLVDMRAAYERLDSATQGQISNLSAYHSTQFSQANDMGDCESTLHPHQPWSAETSVTDCLCFQFRRRTRRRSTTATVICGSS